MNMETLIPGKLYYTIGEVSDYLKLAPSQIRFWETQFSELRPKKTRKGDRRYMEKDIELLKKINHLLKIQGFTIKGAKDSLKKKSIIEEHIETNFIDILTTTAIENVVPSQTELNGNAFAEFSEMLNKMHDYRNALIDARDALIQLRNTIK